LVWPLASGRKRIRKTFFAAAATITARCGCCSRAIAARTSSVSISISVGISRTIPLPETASKPPSNRTADECPPRDVNAAGFRSRKNQQGQKRQENQNGPRQKFHRATIRGLFLCRYCEEKLATLPAQNFGVQGGVGNLVAMAAMFADGQHPCLDNDTGGAFSPLQRSARANGRLPSIAFIAASK
jgi:hypothetical protein